MAAAAAEAAAAGEAAEAGEAGERAAAEAGEQEEAAARALHDFVDGLGKDGEETEESVQRIREQAYAAYYRAGGRAACGGGAKCLELFRILSRKEQAHARFVERNLALREGRSYREPAWVEDDAYEANVRRNAPQLKDNVQSVVREVQRRYGEDGALPEDEGPAERRLAARGANDWYRTLKLLALAGGAAAGLAAFLDAVQNAEMRNSYCSVAAWGGGGGVTRLDCTAAVGTDAERYAALQAECTCLGPVPQPCGGPSCRVLQRCVGLPNFDPAGAHSCKNRYNYSFTQCSVWCGMSSVLHGLEGELSPSHWVRDLLIVAGVLLAAVLLIAFFAR
jgi:hypothetical protein